MSSNKTNLVKAAIVEVCRVCENDFEPPNFESVYCDELKRWVHLNCCGMSGHEFNVYVNNEDPFYCTYCVNELECTVGIDA